MPMDDNGKYVWTQYFPSVPEIRRYHGARFWVNQPARSQPYNRLHGFRVMVPDATLGKDMKVAAHIIDSEAEITLRVCPMALSPGWPKTGD